MKKLRAFGLEPGTVVSDKYQILDLLGRGWEGEVYLIRELSTGIERWIAYPIQRHQLEGRATRDVLPNYAFAPDGSAVFLELRGRIHRLDLTADDVTPVPFEAPVRLQVAERLDFPRAVGTGPVRARRAHGPDPVRPDAT